MQSRTILGVGYVSEGEKLYDWMTGHEFVVTLARLYGFTRDEAGARADHVLNFVNLSDVAHKQIGKYVVVASAS